MSEFQNELFVNRTEMVAGFDRLLQRVLKKAVFLIQGKQNMGKSWLALKMEYMCQQTETSIPVARVDFRNPVVIAQITNHLDLLRLLRDRLEQPQFFEHLNETIRQVTENQTASPGIRQLGEFAKEIQSAYTFADLDELAVFLDVEPENLEGATLFKKAFSFVRHFQQTGTLNVLFERLRSERNHIDWTRHEEALSSPQDFSARVESVDGGLHLAPFTEKEKNIAERQLNDAFFTSLANLIAEKKQALFLFDAYEKASTEVQRFVRAELAPRLKEERFKGISVIVTGRRIPDLSDLEIDYLVNDTELGPLPKEYVSEFMARRNIKESPPLITWESVYLLSGGVPGEMAKMADRVRAQNSRNDAFFE